MFETLRKFVFGRIFNEENFQNFFSRFFSDKNISFQTFAFLLILHLPKTSSKVVKENQNHKQKKGRKLTFDRELLQNKSFFFFSKTNNLSLS